MDSENFLHDDRKTHTHIDAAELVHYSGLKEKALHKAGICIAEGRFLVERLLAASLNVLSVLCTPELEAHFRKFVSGRCPLFVKTPQELAQLTGFPFHRGVLAAYRRPVLPSVAEYLASVKNCGNLVLLPHISEAENLGSILRSSLAMGIQAVCIGDRSADPFGRKTLRCSMGAAFTIPLLSWEDDQELAACLRAYGYSLVGATCSAEARPLPGFRFYPHNALVFGNEADGLPASWTTCCDAFVKIPCSQDVDSLNVGTAAGILLYTLKQQELSR